MTRRKERHDLIRKTQNNAELETNPEKKKELLETADRLSKDMDRVEDARLALHVYTANEDPNQQEGFLKELRDKPPPGFTMACTSVISRDGDEVGTDPLYQAQHKGITSFVMKKPVTTGLPRELRPIDPNLAVPSKEQSETEAHSMLQVIEALERDKEFDQMALKEYKPR